MCVWQMNDMSVSKIPWTLSLSSLWEAITKIILINTLLILLFDSCILNWFFAFVSFRLKAVHLPKIKTRCLVTVEETDTFLCGPDPKTKG